VATSLGESLEAQTQTRHAVQFYEGESFLVDVSARFLATGLPTGDVLVVIATRSHIDALAARADAAGLQRGIASGRVRVFDARSVLDEVTVNGVLHTERFQRFTRRMLDEHPRTAGRRETPARATRRIRAFCQMVDLLWREGNKLAAVRLEELWGEVCEARGVAVLCAHDLSNYSRDDDAGLFHSVCQRHDHVLPAESFSRIDDPRERERAVAILQQRARALESEIQKRRELEDALEEAVRERRRAEHASHVRSELLAAVAQELELPLKAIAGWTALLRTADRVDVREAAETIEWNAKTQTRLLEDLADASRVVGGTLTIHAAPVDLAFLLRASIDAVAPAAMMKEITIDVVIDQDPCMVRADGQRLDQVLSNLLSNAVQFTPEGGKISVELTETQTEIAFTVRDTGCGIHPSALPFVFDRLRRSDDPTAHRGSGIRLGLAVTRHLVELHGGSITAESPGVGCGSTFTVRLPRPRG
jgi:signal transduction histidine kinase